MPGRPEPLTCREVAALVGVHRTQVARWCAARGISRTRVDDRRRFIYPSGPILAAVAAEQPPALRLARFIRNPLNR